MNSWKTEDRQQINKEIVPVQLIQLLLGFLLNHLLKSKQRSVIADNHSASSSIANAMQQEHIVMVAIV